MNKNISKKGGVELSLNLIIMLIIGMVVLALVIGFVNNLVGQGTKTFDDQIGDNDQLELNKLESCTDNLCVLPSPTIRAQKGKDTKIYLKVRNYKTDDAISCPTGQLTSGCGVFYEVVDSVGTATSANDFIIGGAGFLSMKSGDEFSRMYTLRIDPAIATGTYYLTFGLYGVTSDLFEDPVVLTLEVS